MSEQHGLHLIWPLSFSTCWYWTIFPESGVWHSIPICYALLFFQIVFDLWCLHWLVLGWKIAHDAKAMKNHKTTKKKGRNILAFIASLRCAYAATSVKIWKTQKKGWEIYLHLWCLCLSLNDLALQHGKYRKTKKRGCFMLEYKNWNIKKKPSMCLCSHY